MPRLKAQGRGVFACRICGQAIPPTNEWVVIGLAMRSVWEAGYCTPKHQEQGRRAGWTDDLAEWNRLLDARLAATNGDAAGPGEEAAS